MTSYTTIKLETSNGIAVLTLNRPEVLNSINVTMIVEIRDAVKAVAADVDARVLMLTGEGRAFCAGADLAAQGHREEGMSIGEGVAHGMKTGFNPMMSELYALDKPILSAVNGTTAGGGVGLALVADICIAAKSASFISVFGPKLGLIPDLGTTWQLPRLVGRARALGMAITGEKIAAETAADWGLIWKCVDDATLMDVAGDLAAKIAKGPTSALAQIRKALDVAPHNNYDDQLEYERVTQGQLGDHPNFIEGVTAFLGKREAKFK